MQKITRCFWKVWTQCKCFLIAFYGSFNKSTANFQSQNIEATYNLKRIKKKSLNDSTDNKKNCWWHIFVPIFISWSQICMSFSHSRPNVNGTCVILNGFINSSNLLICIPSIDKHIGCHRINAENFIVAGYSIHIITLRFGSRRKWF